MLQGVERVIDASDGALVRVDVEVADGVMDELMAIKVVSKDVAVRL